MPGTTIKVAWPVGPITITDDDPRYDWTMSAPKYIVESADPNDHYRPWMEENVGKQGWDWDWTMMDDDITKNALTIKFRRGKEQLASYFSLRWS